MHFVVLFEAFNAVYTLSKVNCIKKPNVPAGLNLPYKDFNIKYISVKRKSVFEINTPQDYINFIKLNNAK